MEKKKRSRDFNQMAASIVAEATGGKPADLKTSSKNPAAVALGRLGGLKGGKARAESLSAKKRKAIAQKAAKARWSKKS
jgi:hypothetical protein